MCMAFIIYIHLFIFNSFFFFFFLNSTLVSRTPKKNDNCFEELFALASKDTECGRLLAYRHTRSGGREMVQMSVLIHRALNEFNSRNQSLHLRYDRSFTIYPSIDSNLYFQFDVFIRKIAPVDAMGGGRGVPFFTTVVTSMAKT